VEIILSLQNGAVNKVTIVKHDGKKVKTTVLENILRKLKVSSGISGQVKFVLEYN